jgi:ATP/maltotriose-dependent transcriptional regulator MalT
MDRFVGRAAELTALTTAWRRTGRGGFSWAQVIGEAGIGKSRLLLELSATVDRDGALALIGRGAELEQDVPFGPIVDALDDYLAARGEEQIAQMCGGRAPDLAAVFPSLANTSSLSPSLQDQRYRTYRAIRTLLQGLSHRPLLLVIDDLHWADPASVELITFLLRHPPTSPLMLLMAWRPATVPMLGVQLGEAARDMHGVSLALGPLPEQEALELIDPHLDRVSAAALYRESGGNPLFLRELGRASDELAPTKSRQDLLASEVPEAIVNAVRQQLARLPRSIQVVAQAAAVAGESFDLRLLAACAEAPEAEALEALDALVSAAICRPTETPTRFRFRHPILRRAVYDTTAPGFRLHCHARAATSLAHAGAPITMQAHHVARSARVGDRRAARLLADAARSGQPSAPAVAAQWLQAAVGLLPSDSGSTDERLTLLVSLAAARETIGQLSGASEALHEALSLTTPNTSPWVGLVTTCAAIDQQRGRWDAAWLQLTDALAALPGAHPNDAAPLMFQLALARLFRQEYDEADDWAERAAEAATGGELYAAACTLRAMVACSREDTRAATVHCGEAAETIDQLGRTGRSLRPDAVVLLATIEYLLERYSDAERHLLLLPGGDSGDARNVIGGLRARALLLQTVGRLGQAAELANMAIELSCLAGSDWLLGWTLGVQARVLLDQGDLDASRAAGERAVELLPSDSPYATGIRQFLALLELEAGQPARARQHLAASGAPDFPVVEPGTRCAVYEAHARVALADGHLPEAQRCSDLATATARHSGLRTPAAIAHRLHARILLATSQPADAAVDAARAADAAESCGAVIEAARCQLFAGRAYAHANRRSEAVAPIQRAKDLADQCGARRLADEGMQQLRRLGIRQPGLQRRASAGTGVDALSGREREVAGLVAAGNTNRQIAASLYISEKTVESHVARIYSKVGVNGRTALAAVYGRSGGSEAEPRGVS